MNLISKQWLCTLSSSSDKFKHKIQLEVKPKKKKKEEVKPTERVMNLQDFHLSATAI